MFVYTAAEAASQRYNGSTIQCIEDTGNCLWGGMDLCINRRQTQTFNKYLKPHTISLSPSMANNNKNTRKQASWEYNTVFRWFLLHLNGLHEVYHCQRTDRRVISHCIATRHTLNRLLHIRTHKEKERVKVSISVERYKYMSFDKRTTHIK